MAAARLHEARGGHPAAIALDGASVQAAIRSERYFRADGRATGIGFAPQSRFWQADDGFVRTHANYPWHHRALLEAIGTDDISLAGAIGSLPAEELERRVFAAGGIAAAVRTPAEWDAHPHGLTLADEPIVTRKRLGEAVPRRRRPALDPQTGAPEPAGGIRVLDLTRVIAGPVCSRYLGALGADVLRIDPPRLPDLERGHPADTLLGKSSAFLDFNTTAGAETLEALLVDADVLLIGYRPSSLDRFGLAPADLAKRHPGLVVLQIAAWGHSGPWAERRGFDSIVQAASGIASIEADEDGAPGALPCQLLDHGTGYLATAATLEALAEQAREGGTQLRRLSLARTARWLIGATGDRPASTTGGSSSGRDLEPAPLTGPVPVLAVPPPGRIDGLALRWPEPVTGYGDDAPCWIGAGQPTPN